MSRLSTMESALSGPAVAASDERSAPASDSTLHSNQKAERGDFLVSLRTFSQLPARIQEAFRRYEHTGVFLESHDGQKIGVAHFSVNGEELLTLSRAEVADLQRMASLYAEYDLVKHEIVEDLVRSERCSTFATLEGAAKYRETLGDNRDWSIFPCSEGYALVQPSVLIDDVSLQDLQQRCQVIGRRLLAGRKGDYGVQWLSLE